LAASHARSSGASRSKRSRRTASFAAASGSTGRASAARCRASIAAAAASHLAAWRSKSARVPLRRLLALLGSLTPSTANISRPISRRRSQAARTAANTWATSAPTVLTKCATVVKCGAVSPHKAMNVTCSRQSRALPRPLTAPCAQAHRTTVSSIAGG
jgi:hypothetical protein